MSRKVYEPPPNLTANRARLEHDYFRRPEYRRAIRECAREFDRWLKEQRAVRNAKTKSGRPKKRLPRMDFTREAA